MINNVTLVGRLTKDIDLKFTPSGKAVASGTLAVNRAFKNANGEQEADFINLVIWGKPAENTANYTKKGSLIGVTGRISTRNYEGQDGKRIYVTEVVAESVQFLEPKKDNQQSNNYQSNNQQNRQQGDPFANSGQAPYDINSDDLPFWGESHEMGRSIG
jgi:single-strand DNA-binding protein